MTALQLALYLVAGIFAVIELVRTRGASLPGWGVLAVAAAGALPALVAL